MKHKINRIAAIVLSLIMVLSISLVGGGQVVALQSNQVSLQESQSFAIESTSQVRYPTGDFGATGTWAVFPTLPTTKWDKVDEVTPDNDTTYLTEGTTAGYSLFTFALFSIPTNATINSFQVTYTGRDVTSGVNNLRAAIRVGGTNYLTTDVGVDLSTGYISYTYTFITNPKSLGIWTVADINGTGTNPLQVFGTNSSDASPAFRITSVKATVNYTYTTVDTPTMPAYSAMDDGVITPAELVAEVQADPQYSGWTQTQWDLVITQKGISHIDDALLKENVDKTPIDLTEAYKRLIDLYDIYPSASQISAINTTLAKYEAQKVPLTSTLESTKVSKVSNPEVLKAMIQEAANAVAAIDGKISSIQEPLQIPDQVAEQWRFITEKKSDYACAIKEQSLRAQSLVTRTYAHTTYYMDFTPSTHSHATGTLLFTNGSAAVSGGGGSNFDPEITVGDYIRQSDGTQWYKVATRTDDSNLTIAPAFQQATHTDDSGASFICVSATNTGLAIATAFPHLNRYTTDTTRTAGDVLKVRANQTNVVAGIDIAFDEDGTVIAYNEVRGCSVADDPFSDSSNVQPIIDFGNTAFKFTLTGDDYWRLYNLDITNNNLITGLITSTGKSPIYDTLTVHLANNASGNGVFCSSGGSPIIQNCSFYSCKNAGVYTQSGTYYIISGSTFNGGAAQAYGLYVQDGNNYSSAVVSNSTFGVTTTHGTTDIYGVNVRTRNCILTTGVNVPMYSGSITSEDDGQVLGAQKAWYYSGTIQKFTTVLRTGGGTSSALMLPSSVVTIKYPLNLAYGSLDPDFAIWCPASATTVTVYMRANTIWATYPTAAQLFIQADYYAGVTSLRSQSTASTQLITDGAEPAIGGHIHMDAGSGATTIVDGDLTSSANDYYNGWYVYNTTRSLGAEVTDYDGGTKTITCGSIAAQADTDAYYLLNWVGFTTTFTPGTAGFAYIKVNLGLYAAGKGVYVDAKPTAGY
jgi:hypothetical protein